MNIPCTRCQLTVEQTNNELSLVRMEASISLQWLREETVHARSTQKGTDSELV